MKLPAGWNEQVAFAEHHRLAPLLLHALRADTAAPAEVVASLQATVRATAQRNLALFAHTTRIASLLSAAHIESLALKGPALAWQLYGDLHYRVCSDVDVLVRAADFKRAAEVLSINGYRAEVAIDDHTLRRHRARRHDLAFAHADDTLVELHADVAQPHYAYNVDIDRLFGRAQMLHIRGARIAVPCAEHALLLAILHGTRHAWERLDLVADVAALAQQPLDWSEVRLMVRQAGAARAAAVAFRLAEEFAGLAKTEFAYARGDRLASSASDRLVACRQPTYWQTRRFDLAVRERLGDRLRYLVRFGLRFSDKFSFASKASHC